HHVPGSLIRNSHCHFELIALAGAIQFGFDGERQLVQRLASGHLMEVYTFLPAGPYLRINYVSSHAIHMAGLAILTLPGVAAGLPLRVSSEHRQAGGIAVFMARCTDLRRDMDRRKNGPMSHRSRILKGTTFDQRKLHFGLGVRTLESHGADRMAIVARDTLPAHLLQQ